MPIGQMPGYGDQLAILQRRNEAEAENQARMANIFSHMRPQVMPEQEYQPGFSDTLAQGLGQGMASGLTNMVNDYLEHQAYQRALGDTVKLAGAIGPDDSYMDIRKKAMQLGSPRSAVEDVERMQNLHQNAISQEQAEREQVQRMFQQNPGLTAEDLLSAGISPETVNKITLSQSRTREQPEDEVKRKEIASREQAIQARNQATLSNKLKEAGVGMEDERDLLESKAYGYLEAGDSPGKAYIRAKKDLVLYKRDKKNLRDVISEHNPGMFSRNREKESLKSVLAPYKQNNPELVIDELRRAGWKENEIQQILGVAQAQKVDAETAKRFLAEAGGNKDKARQLALEAGYEF